MSAIPPRPVCTLHKRFLDEPHYADPEGTRWMACPEDQRLIAEDDWGYAAFDLALLRRCGYCHQDGIPQREDDFGWQCRYCGELTGTDGRWRDPGNLTDGEPPEGPWRSPWESVPLVKSSRELPAEFLPEPDAQPPF